ncbi:MAG: HEPN domain-containing protein [Candidatus Methylomirabilales bacterium]
MPHDPALVEDTRSWLTRASRDLRAAEHDLRTTPPLSWDAVFHCQQAAEKALKAFLAWHDEPFGKTHNLEELGRQATAFDPSLRALADGAGRLTEYAWKFRYPGEPDEPPREEAEEALALAREVYDAILSRLPEDVRP